MSNTKTGRRGLGDIIGSNGRIRLRDDGRLSDYRLRLARDQVEELVALLGDSPDCPGGRMLTATRENLSRLRVVADPVPGYERRAGPQYVRGDVVRVTGTERSCNIFCSRIGADMVSARLRASLSEAQEWLEIRARVVRHSEAEGPRSMIEIVPDRQFGAMQNDRELGIAGGKLAGAVWAHDSFRDWEEAAGA